jgi:hypothetical protein
MTAERQATTEVRIRAAIKQLTAGPIPSGLACDIKSLCILAAVPRATFYRTYPHLKAEFEASRPTSPTDKNPAISPVDRPTTEINRLRDRIGQLNTQIAELTAFRALALSRLAAQHEEITTLRRRDPTGNGHLRLVRTETHR